MKITRFRGKFELTWGEDCFKNKKRYAQRLTQGYMIYGGSWFWVAWSKVVHKASSCDCDDFYKVKRSVHYMIEKLNFSKHS